MVNFSNIILMKPKYSVKQDNYCNGVYSVSQMPKKRACFRFVVLELY